mmetsp:Transcript_1693/g.3038  ORF Transcript_1693/g.3038 Transcript_1693/m.3038 type:complete len:285 (+) Transcript_1693:1184-2038(+)
MVTRLEPLGASRPRQVTGQATITRGWYCAPRGSSAAVAWLIVKTVPKGRFLARELLPVAQNPFAPQDTRSWCRARWCRILSVAFAKRVLHQWEEAHLLALSATARESTPTSRGGSRAWLRLLDTSPPLIGPRWRSAPREGTPWEELRNAPSVRTARPVRRARLGAIFVWLVSLESIRICCALPLPKRSASIVARAPLRRWLDRAAAVFATGTDSTPTKKVWRHAKPLRQATSPTCTATALKNVRRESSPWEEPLSAPSARRANSLPRARSDAALARSMRPTTTL